MALLRELRDDLNLSIVFITHEMDTVLKIADSVARLDHGSIVESGRPVDLLTDPDSSLGAELRPHGVAADAATGQQAWHVVYDAPDVPSTLGVDPNSKFPESNEDNNITLENF